MLIQKTGIAKLIPLTKYFPYNIIFLFMTYFAWIWNKPMKPKNL
jgi:hypothetical protein